ncbi:uncharacterized protein LOC107815272 [Nicotiana tabacum]|uniref:Uncharacterized protein LOC107815272 n=1 Tax=Nicotiana tabacum TaxID=4097 RepID=A0AC58TNP0_TOBAC
MDVKSVFLNGFIDEEVYVKQPPGFEDSKFSYHVYKLTKALYGLKQALRACVSDPDLIEILTAIDNKLTIIEDLLGATQSTVGDIHAISKYTGSDISKIRVKILKLVENTVKAFKEVYDKIDGVTVLANASFGRLKEAISFSKFFVFAICFPSKLLWSVPLFHLLLLLNNTLQSHTSIIRALYFLLSDINITTKLRNVTRRENNEEDSELEDQDHDPSNHEPWHASTGGLDEAVIKSITVFKYKKGDGLLTEGTDCSVCLSEFQEDESLRLLPKCSHAFHVTCIDTWLKSHSNCPLCRANIIFPNASPPPIMEIIPLANEPTPQVQPENDIEMGIREEESQEEDVTNHINQEVRRSVSMDYESQGRLSIADVLRIDHDEFEDCQLQRDVGTSKLQDNNGEEMSRNGIRNNALIHCVTSPMVIKRSLSSGRLLFPKRGRGQNIDIPLSNI